MGMSLERPQQSLRLVPSLLVFLFRVRVRDDAAADGELEPSPAGGEGADENARVHGAVEADVTKTSAIRPARDRLEFGDDLHGANFRSTRYRAAGESGAEQVDWTFVVAQPS